MIDENQRVDLVAARVILLRLGPRRLRTLNILAVVIRRHADRVAARPHQSPRPAGLSHFHFSVLQAFVERDKRSFRDGFAIGPHHRKEQKIAAGNGIKDPVGAACGLRGSTGRLHAAQMLKCRERKEQRRQAKPKICPGFSSVSSAGIR